jgi:hypothetical protein
MAYDLIRSTAEQSMTGVDKLEHSIAACEELLASLQTTKYPSAGRTRYLLRIRLSNIRQQLNDISNGQSEYQTGDAHHKVK